MSSVEMIETSGQAAAETSGAAIVDPKILMKMIELLTPLTDDGRLRSVEAALTFLGTTWNRKPVKSDDALEGARQKADRGVADADNPATDLPRRATAWLAQNNVDIGVLDSVFHRSSSGVELIANELPGRTIKERTVQTYLLCGIRALLHTGEAKFNDSEAREACRILGAYDATNHASYVKSFGNLMTGTKAQGFELTHPGLRAAAELLRSMTNAT